MDFDSSSFQIVATTDHSASSTHKKRDSSRKKTRHPFYRGVRQRSSGKWVSEMREPIKRSRIWLGTFPNPEMAAVAHDVAAIALHGDAAVLNFPNLAHRLPLPASASHQDIQRAALIAARDITPVSSSCTSTPFPQNCTVESSSICNVFDPSSPSNSLNGNDDRRKINVENYNTFVDEEAIFNMPLLLDCMAEGMLLTPPALKKGFNWSQEADHGETDSTLWRIS